MKITKIELKTLEGTKTIQSVKGLDISTLSFWQKELKDTENKIKELEMEIALYNDNLHRINNKLSELKTK